MHMRICTATPHPVHPGTLTASTQFSADTTAHIVSVQQQMEKSLLFVLIAVPHCFSYYCCWLPQYCMQLTYFRALQIKKEHAHTHTHQLQ